MNSPPALRPELSAALRAELIRHIDGQTKHWWQRRHFLLWGSITASLLVAGSGTAIAASVLLPGAQQTVALGTAISASGDGDGQVELGLVPDGASGVAVALTCITPGDFTFSDKSSFTCTGGDEGSTVSVLLPLSETVTVTADDGSTWTLEAAYVNSVTSPWSTNADGQTYGIANSNGTPDLVATVATNGKQGYSYSAVLVEAVGGGDFSSPAEALKWQKENEGTSVNIPVYQSDGKTRIGDFLVER